MTSYIYCFAISVIMPCLLCVSWYNYSASNAGQFVSGSSYYSLPIYVKTNPFGVVSAARGVKSWWKRWGGLTWAWGMGRRMAVGEREENNARGWSECVAKKVYMNVKCLCMRINMGEEHYEKLMLCLCNIYFYFYRVEIFLMVFWNFYLQHIFVEMILYIVRNFGKRFDWNFALWIFVPQFFYECFVGFMLYMFILFVFRRKFWLSNWKKIVLDLIYNIIHFE